MMGYASHRASSIGLSSLSPELHSLVGRSKLLYTSQLVLNLVWMPLFFRLGRPIAALIDIVLLTANVGLLTATYAKIDKIAAWIMVPYLAWLSFATWVTANLNKSTLVLTVVL